MKFSKTGLIWDPAKRSWPSTTTKDSSGIQRRLRLARLKSLMRFSSWSAPLCALLGILILFDDGLVMLSASISVRWTLATIALFCSLYYLALNLMLSRVISDCDSQLPGFLHNRYFLISDSIALLLTMPILVFMMAHLIFIKDLNVVYTFYFVASIASILFHKFSLFVILGVVLSLCIIFVAPAAGILDSTGPGNVILLWVALLANGTLYIAYKAAQDTEKIFDDVVTQNLLLEQGVTDSKITPNPGLDSVSRNRVELRNPLHEIYSHIRILARSPRLSGSELSKLKMLERTSLHLRSAINEVLDCSDADPKNMSVLKDRIDIIQVVRDVAALYEVSALEKGLKFSVDIHPDLKGFSYVSTDGSKYWRIVSNLLSNSVKYTESGWIRITLELVHVRRSIDESGADELELPEIRCTVADTGKGIRVQDYGRIFEPIQRNGRQCNGIEGTGSGLPISKQLAERLGGTITLESVVDVGSRFTFSLPLGKQDSDLDVIADPSEHKAFSSEWSESRNVSCEIVEDVSVASVATPSPKQLHSDVSGESEALYEGDLRILVVDDSEINRNLMVDILGRLDCVIETAADGDDAVQMVSTWKPGIIFMDLQMPGLNGIEATKQIRAQDNIEQPLIVACTGSTFNHKNERFMEAGVNRMLLKPFVIKDVVKIVEEYSTDLSS